LPRRNFSFLVPRQRFILEFLDSLAEYKIDIRRSDRFVINERVATAAGVTSGIDLALALVARLWGENLAARVAENIEWKY
jgi:transcriptional regulator GlxA family with amidase domain